MFVSGDYALRDGEGHRGLADAPGSDDCHQPLPRKARDDCPDKASSRPIIRVTAFGRLCASAEAIVEGVGDAESTTSPRLDGGDKIVAPSGNGDDVAMAALAVAEGPAQGMYLDLEVRFFDEGLRPGMGDQFVLADHFAGAFHKGGQYIEGAASEADRLAALKQEPLCREQPKWPKRNRLSVHRVARNVHSFYPF